MKINVAIIDSCRSDAGLHCIRERHCPTISQEKTSRPIRARYRFDAYLCDFFYEMYKNAPRDKLLEWMVGAPDIERLRTLPQKDLAIIICERWAYSAFQAGNEKRAS
jgi:hypothetical protein